MKTFLTPYGKISLITLSKFFDLLNVRVVNPDTNTYEFNQLVGYNSFDPYDTSDYVRRSVLLLEGDRRKILTAGLISQATVGHAFLGPTGYQDNFEAICVDSLENFGGPEYLVKVGPRRWMAARLSDFNVVTNGRDHGLACYCQLRTKIFEIDRLTKDEVIERYKQYSDDTTTVDDPELVSLQKEVETLLAEIPSEYQVNPNEGVLSIVAGLASIELRPNGDILVSGRLAANDLEVVEGMRAIIAGFNDEIPGLAVSKKSK